MGRLLTAHPRGGHIPRALHIDWRNFYTSDGRLKKREDLNYFLTSLGVEHNQEVVVYCTGGVRSGMAYFALKTLGFEPRNYDGSWWDWSHNSSLPSSL